MLCYKNLIFLKNDLKYINIMSYSSKIKKISQFAAQQGGCFTAQQAIDFGIVRNNHSYHLKVGNWIKEYRGVYRLASLPVNELTFYWALYLWAYGQDGEPKGVFSHATALSFYGLSDYMSTEVYLSFSERIRKTQTPKILVLMRNDLISSDIELYEGMKVTSPIKTLVDLEKADFFSTEFLSQAVKQALNQGLITKKHLFEHEVLAKWAL